MNKRKQNKHIRVFWPFCEDQVDHQYKDVGVPKQANTKKKEDPGSSVNCAGWN